MRTVQTPGFGSKQKANHTQAHPLRLKTIVPIAIVWQCRNQSTL
jgi:hypothetical protein